MTNMYLAVSPSTFRGQTLEQAEKKARSWFETREKEPAISCADLRVGLIAETDRGLYGIDALGVGVQEGAWSVQVRGSVVAHPLFGSDNLMNDGHWMYSCVQDLDSAEKWQYDAVFVHEQEGLTAKELPKVTPEDVAFLPLREMYSRYRTYNFPNLPQQLGRWVSGDALREAVVRQLRAYVAQYSIPLLEHNIPGLADSLIEASKNHEYDLLPVELSVELPGLFKLGAANMQREGKKLFGCTTSGVHLDLSTRFPKVTEQIALALG